VRDGAGALPVTPHALIASPVDVVRCDRLRCTLTAGRCADRHVAREHRGHRANVERGNLARHPSCATCPMGGVALVRLGRKGTPGRLVTIRLGDVAGEP
jgi:hypothetical protein